MARELEHLLLKSMLQVICLLERGGAFTAQSKPIGPKSNVAMASPLYRRI